MGKAGPVVVTSDLFGTLQGLPEATSNAPCMGAPSATELHVTFGPCGQVAALHTHYHTGFDTDAHKCILYCFSTYVVFNVGKKSYFKLFQLY